MIWKKNGEILEEYLENLQYIGNTIIMSDEIVKVIDYKEIKALETLLKRYKELEEDYNKLFDGYNKRVEEITELEEENKTLTDEYMIQKHLINADFLKDYIPISVIQNKINRKQKQLEDLKSNLKGKQTNFVNKNMILAATEILQELLEERNK